MRTVPGAQPTSRYIDVRKGRWGIEPICRALQFAPSTYHATKSRAPSARALRDEELKVEVTRVHTDNLAVYGVRKVYAQLNREGIQVARCTVVRLMKDLGLEGTRRGRRFKRTTITNELMARPSDLVHREFSAAAPTRLWVADLTYVKSFSGWVYVAFVIDVSSRMIVGGQVSTSLRSDLAIDALEMAIFARRGEGDLEGLTHHSDRGVQHLAIRHSERLAAAGAVAWVGSKGDGHDISFAESFNGLYKAEQIHRQGPWRNVEHVKWAALTYVDWFNHRRLHGEIGMVPPAEFEENYYRDREPVIVTGSQAIEPL